MLSDAGIPYARELKGETVWNGKPETKWIDDIAPGTAEAIKQKTAQIFARKTKRLRRMQSQNAIERAVHDFCEVLGLTKVA